jgi:hypothetical protein
MALRASCVSPAVVTSVCLHTSPQLWMAFEALPACQGTRGGFRGLVHEFTGVAQRSFQAVVSRMWFIADGRSQFEYARRVRTFVMANKTDMSLTVVPNFWLVHRSWRVVTDSDRLRPMLLWPV